jgi:hypothetical protein
MTMNAILGHITPAQHRRHALHGDDRAWPETNCHTDLWIELLAALGRDPRAALGMTIAIDFEGDQFTFFKMRAAEIEAFYGVELEELTVYRPLADHVETLVARGHFPLIEVDAHYLPDTQGLTYRTGHSKTTIAINRFDRAARHLEYFHNAGYFEADGDDVAGLLALDHTPTLPPYSEYVKVTGPGLAAAALARQSRQALEGHMARRPGHHPLLAYRDTIDGDLLRLGQEGQSAFHAYAFAVFRQYGAAMELLSAHLAYLSEFNQGDFAEAAKIAGALSSAAKTLQFVAARAVMRRTGDGLKDAVTAMATDHSLLVEAVAAGLVSRATLRPRAVGA